MRIDILTLFPQMFSGPFDHSIIKRATQDKLAEIYIHDIRDHTHDKHRVVDDYPYGGGAGMVMKPEPIFEAVEAVQSQPGAGEGPGASIILLSPQGRLLHHRIAQELAEKGHLILICGHWGNAGKKIPDQIVKIRQEPALCKINGFPEIMVGLQIFLLLFHDSSQNMPDMSLNALKPSAVPEVADFYYQLLISCQGKVALLVPNTRYPVIQFPISWVSYCNWVQLII